MSASPEDATQWLVDWSNGDPAALDKLMPLVYNELRGLANHYLRRERPAHTLQPTALVHEVYLRLIDQTSVRWQDRTHFIRLAANVMRRILVEYARSHNAAKRQSGGNNLTLDQVVDVLEARDIELIALDGALIRLAASDPQQSRIVEL